MIYRNSYLRERVSTPLSLITYDGIVIKLSQVSKVSACSTVFLPMAVKKVETSGTVCVGGGTRCFGGTNESNVG